MAACPYRSAVERRRSPSSRRLLGNTRLPPITAGSMQASSAAAARHPWQVIGSYCPPLIRGPSNARHNQAEHWRKGNHSMPVEIAVWMIVLPVEPEVFQKIDPGQTLSP